MHWTDFSGANYSYNFYTQLTKGKTELLAYYPKFISSACRPWAGTSMNWASRGGNHILVWTRGGALCPPDPCFAPEPQRGEQTELTGALVADYWWKLFSLNRQARHTARWQQTILYLPVRQLNRVNLWAVDRAVIKDRFSDVYVYIILCKTHHSMRGHVKPSGNTHKVNTSTVRRVWGRGVGTGGGAILNVSQTQAAHGAKSWCWIVE